MLEGKDKEEIKKYEETGIDVVAANGKGKLEYVTGGMANKQEFCDCCESFVLLPDPDPYDWFRDGDKKAVCLAVRGVIQGSLERPSEWINIRKPIYCPKLGRELTEEEKEKAKIALEWAKKE